MIFITSLLPSLKSPTLGIKLQVCITNYAVTAGFFLSTQKPTCLKLKHPSVPRFLALHRKQTTAIPVLELITLSFTGNTETTNLFVVTDSFNVFAFKYFDFCSLRLNIPTTFSSLEKYLLYVSVTPAAGLRCSFPSSWRDNYIVFLMTPLVSGSFSLYCRIYALTTEIVLHPSACYTRKMITILLGLNLASKSLTICITHQL